MKPLSRLCDSEDRWHHTLRHHHEQDLQMEPLNADSSLYFWSIGKRLSGFSEVCVDHMLRCRTPDFLRDLKGSSRDFDATLETMRNSNFPGANLRQTESGIETDMSDYIEKLTFPVEHLRKPFASFRAKFASLVYSRPHVCARVAKLAQVTEQHFRTDARSIFECSRIVFNKHRSTTILSQLSCS
jgi:hypothetical protein